MWNLWVALSMQAASNFFFFSLNLEEYLLNVKGQQYTLLFLLFHAGVTPVSLCIVEQAMKCAPCVV